MKETIATKQKRILFANFPADGHFNPLTGIAAYLMNAGYDVRWYSSSAYADKIRKLNIQHYRFKKAVDVPDNNFDLVFPERTKKKNPISKLKFDIINAFILRGPEYYEDIKAIYDEFPFDLMIADCAFTGIPFVKELMNIPVLSIGVLPLTENSKDLPPCGLGMEPSHSFAGRIKQSLLRLFADKVIFGQPNKLLHQLFDQYKIKHNKESLFDMLIHKCDYLLQSGTPGFEYKRTDMSTNIRFIGPLLPHASNIENKWYDERLDQFEKVVVVTQGTVEKDIHKLLVPTLEAFKNTSTLVVCTTGGSGTAELKAKYPHHNIIIKDFIPFCEVMPYADAYITNGGYGGVMLGIQNRLPLVVAGVHEGKNEICARVGYFKYGINLKTEKPSPAQLKAAVQEVTTNSVYKTNVKKLAQEFAHYSPYQLCLEYVVALTAQNNMAKTKMKAIVSYN